MCLSISFRLFPVRSHPPPFKLSATAGAATTVSLMFFGKENQLILYCHFCVCVRARGDRARPTTAGTKTAAKNKRATLYLPPLVGKCLARRNDDQQSPTWPYRIAVCGSFDSLFFFLRRPSWRFFSPPSFPPLNLVCLSLVIDDKELWSRCGPSVDDRKGACQTGETKVKTKQSEKSTKPKALVERGGRKRRGGSTMKKLTLP